MAPVHSLAECPQNPTLEHILSSLKRLDAHGERTAVAMERMAENAATIEAQTKRLDGHDTALIELFNWRRTFEEKQDGDFRNNLAKINAMEKAIAINAAIEEVVEKAEAKKEQWWHTARAKLEVATPFVMIGFFLLWVADKFGVFEKLFKLVSEFKHVVG